MAKLYAIKSFYDARLGVITLEDDVMSVVRQVRDLYGDRVDIELDPHTGSYHFVEHCADGADRLIFTTDTLDPRALERLQQADSQSRGYEDGYDKAEAEQDAIHKAQDDHLSEKIREPVERLIHTLKADGNEPQLPTVVPVSGRRRERGRPSA